MRRREVIKLIALMALPVAANAQQAESVRRLGILLVNTESDPEGQARITAFRRALQELGWVEGRNLQINYRWAAGEPDAARAYAKEMLALEPDVIVANGTPAVAAVQRATRSIPVVFVVVTDPVGAGYVHTLARPGGNITGFSTFEPEIGGKWLELLREVDPGLSRVAGVLDPDFRGFAAVWETIESFGPRLGVEVTNIKFRHPADDLESAVAAFGREAGGGLIVLPTAINNSNRGRIISLAARHRLPAVYPFGLYAASGGLMSYGVDTIDLFRRSASYVDRILRGEDPADLPVQAPTKFELVINLDTASALGLELPPSLLARADEVIE